MGIVRPVVTVTEASGSVIRVQVGGAPPSAASRAMPAPSAPPPAVSPAVITGRIPLDGVGDVAIKYEVRHEGKQVVVMFDATGVRFSGYYSDAAAREGRGEWGMAEVFWELQGTSNITNADRTKCTTYVPGNETMLGKVFQVKDPKLPVVLGTLVHHSVTQ
jgi:hypothetical protein